MIEVVPYEPKWAKEWDTFVAQAKNGHFMFTRQYLQYHADRFQDASLLFYQKEKLVALLPAHKTERQLISHGGLTFGGFVTSPKMTYSLMQEVFNCLKSFMREQQLEELHYRAIPACYHKMPAQEDLAALSQLGATLTTRDIASVIDLKNRPKYYKGFRWSLEKARKAGTCVRYTQDFAPFMHMLSQMLLDRYQSTPVHTLEEITQLAACFPENIQLYQAHSPEGELLAGVVVYVTPQTVHTQYIASTAQGKQLGAVAWLLHNLMEQFSSTRSYFSLGTSRGGEAYVNENLLHFKESLGARAILQEQYIWRINE